MRAPSSEEFRSLPYSTQVEDIQKMAETDPQTTWQFLKDTFLVNGKQVGNAHDLSHIIGHAAYQKYGFNGIRMCDTSFSYGCFHGVTEEMLLKEGLNNLKAIEDACYEAFPHKDIGYMSCIHGIGHGVYESEEGNIQKALVDCNVIDAAYSQYCYDGVFMEHAGEGREQGAVAIDEKNPWQFCSQFETQYQVSCARYQVSEFLASVSGTDQFAQSGAYCALAPSATIKDTCYENLGYLIAESYLGNTDNILRTCNTLSLGADTCIAGAAVETVFQRYRDENYVLDNLCSKIAEPKKSYCTERLKQL
jgi:hypothetical protein